MKVQLKTTGDQGPGKTYLQLKKKKKQILDFHTLQPRPTATILKWPRSCSSALVSLSRWTSWDVSCFGLVSYYSQVQILKSQRVALINFSFRSYVGHSGQQRTENMRPYRAAVPRGDNRLSRHIHMRWIPDQWLLDFDWGLLLSVVRERKRFNSSKQMFLFSATSQGDFLLLHTDYLWSCLTC